MTAPLARVTTVDALADAIRRRILDGELAPGTPLREQHLADEYAVARHTLRAALRALATEGVAVLEPHRGVRVRPLDRPGLEALAELRLALEVEGARLALERHDGRLPRPVHTAADAFADACHAGGWAAITDAHEALHHAIVAASQSPRLVAAHAALGGELRLFLAALRPSYDPAPLADDHHELVARIERDGPEVLRPHVAASTALLAAQLPV